MISVRFEFLTGIRRPLFRHARLAGDWDGWVEAPMDDIVGADGCPGFAATVAFDDAMAGTTARWGVRGEGPQGPNLWLIATEVADAASTERHRSFVLPAAGAATVQRYWLTSCRRLGAQKAYAAGAAAPALTMAVWAPNAHRVDAVFATRDHGYIGDDGTGIDPTMPVIPLERGDDGVWSGTAPDVFARFVGTPYMFRIDTGGPVPAFRTDIHSRWQIGRGDTDPARRPWDGDPRTLDGTVGCSAVVDQDVVRIEFEPTTSPPEVQSNDDFWRSEFTPGLTPPGRVEDLVIYELHVGSLGYPRHDTGTLADAMAILDHLGDLGVNAVELLPIAEFSGSLGWGYGDTHHLVIESSAGGRDKYKHFVRECHRRGIAVIQDVVYNHFDPNAGRAEWQYDSTLPEQNIYYWYEGRSADYPRPDGGYLNNGSTGYAPRYREEQVRQLFISSAAQFVEEFHVDGLRVDLTQAIHRDNSLNANGWGVAAANQFGQKLLREWSRTLRLIRPSVVLIAEDHTGWPAVTETPDAGGLGFDATWFAAFYHHLVGDSDAAGGASRLLHDAGFGDDGPLAMGQFAGRLAESGANKVVYHESHDEAGNAGGSLRTAKAAVNDAPLFGVTRDVAEARCRVACGLTLLSAATPMFFMGEEIVAQKLYRYDNVADAKEDLVGERRGAGARMFRFYQDVIHLARHNRAVRSRSIDVVHADDSTRVIAFTRRDGTTDILVVASLNNQPFAGGYEIRSDAGRLPDGDWREILNSDSALYGGRDIGNFGAAVPARDGRVEVRLPAHGFVVFQRQV